MDMGVSWNRYPQIIHFSKTFHEINHPAIGVPPWPWKPPYHHGSKNFHGILGKKKPHLWWPKNLEDVWEKLPPGPSSGREKTARCDLTCAFTWSYTKWEVIVWDRWAVASHEFWGDLTTAWWFGTCFCSIYLGNFIIPSDELILFRGVETTNQKNRQDRMEKKKSIP